MNHDARFEHFDDTSVQIAFALRRSAREQHDVGFGERALERRGQLRFVVAEGAQEVGIAAELANRVGQDAPIAVVDEPRSHRFAGLNDLVAGR